MWLLGPMLFSLLPLVHAADAAASAATLINATVVTGEFVPLYPRRRTSFISLSFWVIIDYEISASVQPALPPIAASALNWLHNKN